MATRAVPFNSSVAVSPVPGSSEHTNYRKVKCSVPPHSSFCRVFGEIEVFIQHAVQYTCESGYTVFGSVGKK